MKKKVVKKSVLKTAVPKKRKTQKKSLVQSFGISKEEFFGETEKIFIMIRELKSEMTERFEKHENIILAEYRHRIESLEEKVRKLTDK